MVRKLPVFEFARVFTREIFGIKRQSLKPWDVSACRHMSGEPASKRPCMMKIGTHNGTFHCDEVLACFMLKQLPKYKDAEIVRTRDAAVLDTCDIVVDVGGVFDTAKNRFDHHQRTFSESMTTLRPDKAWETKLSSAGLVYVHFGAELLAQILALPRDDPVTNIVYDKVYENFVEEIDATDNGINQTDGVQKYRITTTLSSRVGNLNPQWNQTGVDIDAQFRKAMEMVGAEFMDRVLYYKQSWLPARDLVQTAIKQRKEVDESGEIICIKEEGGVPWKDHLFSLEAELGVSPPIKYILYTDQNGAWRIQCVPVRVGSFENRLSILEEWRGVRDEELTKKSGIPGCIFVHAGGFIGGNKTYDGVLEMARRCVKQTSS
ncbi:MYG1 exonuclease-like [Haliotis cracherodii]|uniref:MYG1 exonuclease-like n=1 Tax=Haliotis cracherodii TaxID=6455 RepID=UPI0039E97818